MKPTIQEVLTVVSNYYDVSIKDISGPRRYARIRDARHMFLYVAYQLTGMSMDRIAQHVNRDHSTVNHVVRKFEYMNAEEAYCYRDLVIILTGKEFGISPWVQQFNNLGRHFMITKTADFTHRLATLHPKNLPKKYA